MMRLMLLIRYINMKKILLIILLLIPLNIFAVTKDNAILYKCVDGDTARFLVNKEEVKVRFIGINSPESVKPNEEAEPYGKEASNYTCRKLKNAEKIVLEYEDKAENNDKYGRKLAYVFVDGKLLEELIVKNGYAEVKYINSNYKYYNTLIEAQNKAIENKKGIYSDSDYSEEKMKKDIVKIIKKYSNKIFSNILREIFK